MNLETLPVSLLRQWAYCPRIPFIREILGSSGKPAHWVQQGVRFDEVEHLLQRDRRLKRLGLESYRRHRRIALRSESLGVHGIPDLMLVGHSDIVVADYKLDGGPIRRGTRLQLGAYGLLATEHFGLPIAGLLVIFGKPVRASAIPYTPILVDEVHSAIAKLRHVLAAGRLPTSDAGPEKCGICEHLNFCNDRE